MSELIFAVILGCLAASSLRLAFTGDSEYSAPPEDRLERFIFSPRWTVALILLVPWHLGAYGRGETSPLPWVAFRQEAHHGIDNAIFAALVVAVVDLWLLWIPAQIYIARRPDLDGEKKKLLRLVNLLAGLLLVSEGNPFYGLIDALGG